MGAFITQEEDDRAVLEHREVCNRALLHAQHAEYRSRRGEVDAARTELEQACKAYNAACRITMEFQAPAMRYANPAVRDYIRTVARRVRVARDLRGSMLAPLVHAV